MKKRTKKHNLRKNTQGVVAFNKMFQRSSVLNKGNIQSSAKTKTTTEAWKIPYHEAYQLFQKNEFALALNKLDNVAKKFPQEVSVQNMYGVLLAQMNQYKEAIVAWQKVLEKNPNNVNVLSNIGRAFEKMGQYAQAEEYLNKAIALDNQHINTLINMGVLAQRQEKFDQGKKCLEKVLKLEPHNLKAMFNLATIYQHQLDLLTAHRIYQNILKISPQYVDAMANLIFTQHYLMPQRVDVIAKTAFQLGKTYASLQEEKAFQYQNLDTNKKLTIGLVSADLRDHPVGYFIEGLLTSEQTTQFDWVAYANTSNSSALTQRIKVVFKQWHHVDTWSDVALVKQIQADQIDVLIDLSGYTGGNRLSVFSRKPAPLQVTWLGYFGTTGLPTMDAIIADPNCLPVNEEKYFSEKVWRLPDTRFCFAAPTNAPAVNELPALNNQHLTFACFQSLPKINEEVLKVWVKIAKQLPNAKWRLQNARLAPGSVDQQLLKKKMLALGFEESQLEFYGSMPREDYFTAHNEIDFILDTFAYPGGTTTVEALWMGVPTLTFAQPGMLARQGQQLMSAAGYKDWVCFDEESYIEKTLYWAQSKNWTELNKIRLSMRNNVAQSPVFNNVEFAQNWSQLIRDMWQDTCAKNNI